MDINPEGGHIYIGTRAGDPVEEMIDNATESIVIVSPYVSVDYLYMLLEKQRQSVDVTLIAHNIYGLSSYFQHRNAYQRLFIQSSNRLEQRHAIRTYGLLSCGLILSLAFLATIVVFAFRPELFQQHIIEAATSALVFLFLVGFAGRFFWRMRTYEYYYRSRFKRFCWLNDYLGSAKVGNDHVKLYVFDKVLACCGSLNLTYKGMRVNTESRVDIVDRKSVSKLHEWAVARAESHHNVRDIESAVRPYFDEPAHGHESWWKSLRDLINS